MMPTVQDQWTADLLVATARVRSEAQNTGCPRGEISSHNAPMVYIPVSGEHRQTEEASRSR